MRPSNPLLLALTLFGLVATACGEGELTPEEQAEYGDEHFDELEQALPIGVVFGGGAPLEAEDGDTPNEVPICPDCYVRINTSGGYVSSISPLLMTLRDRLPSGASVELDKFEVRSSAGLLAQFDLNGFSPSLWTQSHGAFFWASNVSTTAMPLSQRSPSNWGTAYTFRVKLRYRTAAGVVADIYFPVAVQRASTSNWQMVQF